MPRACNKLSPVHGFDGISSQGRKGMLERSSFGVVAYFARTGSSSFLSKLSRDSFSGHPADGEPEESSERT